jgi:hypothetical protein
MANKLDQGRMLAWYFAPVALRCSVVCFAVLAGQCFAYGGSGGPLAITPATRASCRFSEIAALVPMECSWP